MARIVYCAHSLESVNVEMESTQELAICAPWIVTSEYLQHNVS